MNRTNRHVIAGVVWFLSLPAAIMFILSSESGWVALQAMGGSIGTLWGGGVMLVFCSWALRDAPEHGKARNIAWAFTLAWILLVFFAVFPYLFVTRGAKQGLLASIKYLCLLLAVAIAFVGIIPWLGRTFF